MTSQNAPDRVIKNYFSKYDNDGSGHLNSTEFGKVCYDMGLFLDKVELDAALHQLDSGQDGRIGLDEFSQWWKSPDRMKILEAAEKPVVQQAIAYFQQYDKDSSGSINVTEFKQLCTDLGWGVDNISKSLSALDKNGDGVIDFNEFLIWLRWDVK
jgi:Ca2+-binding EF-hand superfamily protein